MSTPAATMVIRMKPLPRRHRMAHLRALVRQERAGSVRREQLAALLRHETAVDAPGRHSERRAEQPSIAVSPELAACVASKMT